MHKYSPVIAFSLLTSTAFAITNVTVPDGDFSTETGTVALNGAVSSVSGSIGPWQADIQGVVGLISSIAVGPDATYSPDTGNFAKFSLGINALSSATMTNTFTEPLEPGVRYTMTFDFASSEIANVIDGVSVNISHTGDGAASATIGRATLIGLLNSDKTFAEASIAFDSPVVATTPGDFVITIQTANTAAVGSVVAFDNFALSYAAVPESSHYALLFGALTVGIVYRRTRRKS
ncbi:MAG: hypothetical protein ACQKBV_07980 [Puniceicoccales bacterium]